MATQLRESESLTEKNTGATSRNLSASPQVFPWLRTSHWCQCINKFAVDLAFAQVIQLEVDIVLVHTATFRVGNLFLGED
jgi:hypothetical protein